MSSFLNTLAKIFCFLIFIAFVYGSAYVGFHHFDNLTTLNKTMLMAVLLTMTGGFGYFVYNDVKSIL